jgi:hypothetical protein
MSQLQQYDRIPVMHLLSAFKPNDVHDRYTAPVTLGKVDLDKASKSHLLCLTILEKVNSQLIAYLINKEQYIVSYPSAVTIQRF